MALVYQKYHIELKFFLSYTLTIKIRCVVEHGAYLQVTSTHVGVDNTLLEKHR
jgi:hypothetical protein